MYIVCTYVCTHALTACCMHARASIACGLGQASHNTFRNRRTGRRNPEAQTWPMLDPQFRGSRFMPRYRQGQPLLQLGAGCDDRAVLGVLDDSHDSRNQRVAQNREPRAEQPEQLKRESAGCWQPTCQPKVLTSKVDNSSDTSCSTGTWCMAPSRVANHQGRSQPLNSQSVTSWDGVVRLRQRARSRVCAPS